MLRRLLIQIILYTVQRIIVYCNHFEIRAERLSGVRSPGARSTEQKPIQEEMTIVVCENDNEFNNN